MLIRRHVNKFSIEGILKLRALPAEWTLDEYEKYYLKLTKREKEKYSVGEFHNLITANGISQLLTYCGSSTTGTLPFCSFFAVGTFPLSTPYSGDTLLAGEFFRLAPTAVNQTNANTTDISIFFGSAQGNAAYTNCGLFGGNATSTPQSGTLMTHLMYKYTKTSAITLSNDYSIIINSQGS